MTTSWSTTPEIVLCIVIAHCRRNSLCDINIGQPQNGTLLVLNQQLTTQRKKFHVVPSNEKNVDCTNSIARVSQALRKSSARPRAIALSRPHNSDHKQKKLFISLASSNNVANDFSGNGHVGMTSNGIGAQSEKNNSGFRHPGLLLQRASATELTILSMVAFGQGITSG